MDERQQAAAPAVVRARALAKRFGALTAVDGIDFSVRRGEAFGFLGPNGAGKTSTMRMIATTSPVSGGHLEVLGLDPVHDGARIRARLGVVPQEDTLDSELTVEDSIIIYGRYFGLRRRELRERTAGLLDFVQLGDRRHSKVDELSGGMKRRLVIARALVSEPDIVLLDEPTTGLDPQARHLVWDRLYRLKQRGTTLILTTHYMEEAEQLCDRLVIMDRARIVAHGTPERLIADHVPSDVVEVRGAPGAHERVAPLVNGLAMRVEVLPDRLLAYTDDAGRVAAAVDEQADGAGSLRMLVRRATLEDVFLRLTGRTLVD